MMTRNETRSADHGFTLVEVIVVIGILALVMTALTAAFTVFVRNQGSITARLQNTSDLQNLTNFLPGDVASSRLVESDMTGNTLDEVSDPLNTCGTGGDVLLHLEWNEFWTTSYSSRVTYRAFPNATSPTEIERFLCQNNDPATSIVVARSFDGVTVELQRSGGNLTGTVDVRFTYPGEFKRVTGTSRHFLP